MQPLLKTIRDMREAWEQLANKYRREYLLGKRKKYISFCFQVRIFTAYHELSIRFSGSIFSRAPLLLGEEEEVNASDPSHLSSSQWAL